MAEVFLALREGLGGFEKLVVVKRIFPHFCEDEQFVRMFIDEARLAASLSHPNVVQIQDIRRDADGFFIVMEYLSGETLSFLFEHLEPESSIPVPIVCRIGADVAAGLHHAHSHTDDDGHPAPIIHRDVTPSNVIVCFNGVTKLVDFGVAKAERRSEDSRPGTLKGKLAYLSPEQVEDLPVDPRTDVFQLGVVLHEMLTGKRLFTARGEHHMMKAILEQPIAAPSTFNPEVPQILDEVVLSALERNLERRTASADELRRQLERVVGELGTASQHEVADWMQSTFASRYRKRLKIERESVAQMRSGRPSGEMPAITSAFEDTAPVGGGGGEEEASEPSVVTVLERPSGRMAAVTPPPVRRSPAAWIAVVAAGGVAAALVLWLRPESSATARSEPAAPPAEATPLRAEPAAPMMHPPDAGTGTFAVELVTIPPTARIELDGREVGRGEWADELVADGTTHRLKVSADGYAPETILFRNAPPPGTITLEAVAPGPVGSRSPDAGAATRETPVPDARPRPPNTDNLDPWALPLRPKTDNLDPWSR